ncbi:MAG TPA: glycerophosphodiester phosphodiesterase family protein [Flavitalea sp.]|nr:glycerophosphodiester phosphodiesterase family protein [Flavitalea sp.]
MKALLLGYCLLTGVVPALEAQSRAAFPLHKYPVVVIAHRGDHTKVPENTIASYQHAINAGADYVEVDLRTTSDGQLVVMHDGTVDRMTNGTGKVKELTYNTIRSLKVADKSKPGSASFRVPNFEEVLNACKGKINIYLDFKDADVKKVYALLKSKGMAGQVVVYLNAESQYTNWKSIAPEMPLITSVPPNTKTADDLIAFLDKFQVSAIDGSPGDYDQEMMSVIHKRNVQVWLDVQDKSENPQYWTPIVESKVDGMQSDHPGDLVKFLKQKGLH